MVVWNGWIFLLFVCCATVPSTRAWVLPFDLSRAPNSRQTRHRSSSHGSQQSLAYFYSTHSRISSRLEASSTESSALTTTRLPLTRIFNGGREYLFRTGRNVRSFEWSTTELEDLFESIICLGVNDELELNAITILPADIGEEEQKDIGITSRIYDVHDGQQRLVSLSLFMAAMRDNLSLWGEDYVEDVKDVSDAIFPEKSRRKSVDRIKLREKNNELISHILTKLDKEGNNCPELIIPNKKSRKNMVESDKLILEAYEYFLQRIEELGGDKAIELLANAMDKVYVLVCIPANTKIARNIVMGLGKGKNLEPVDEFKGMVCFNSIKDEDKQDVVLEKWNRLSEEVGRKVLENACVILAQTYLRRRVQRNGEMDMMEDFLKDYMERGTDRDGSSFFDEQIAPVAKTLKSFRDGHISLKGKPEKLPSLPFLRAATQIPTSKEIEPVVLYLLRRWQSTAHEEEKARYVNDLHKLEGIALWMMLTKPAPKSRLERCFQIMGLQDTQASENAPMNLSKSETLEILQALDENQFGSNGPGSKIAKAILERVNEFELVKSSQGRVNPIEATLQLEHVLPQKYGAVGAWTRKWDTDSAGEWMHRLGNLALLNQKVNAKISNGPFETKKDHLALSPYPLTRQMAKHTTWDVKAVKSHHKTVIRLAILIWDLA